MRFRVRNWRCIEDASLELSRVIVFIGENSSGKSSLAYAIYFISKLPIWKDPNDLLNQISTV